MEPGMKTAWPTSRCVVRQLGMTGREGARGALAVDEHVAPAVALALGDVVGDVVDLPRAGRRVGAEHAADRLAHVVRHRVAVGPREVGRRRHGGEVGLALGRGRGRAGELAVGQRGSRGAPSAASMRLDVVRADLVAEAARAGVDERRDRALRAARRRAPPARRRRARTRWSSTKWLPEPIVPSCPAPRVARALRDAAPGRRRPGGRRTPCARCRPRVPMPWSRRARAARRAGRGRARRPDSVQAVAAPGAGGHAPEQLVDERLASGGRARRASTGRTSRRTPQLMS